MSGPGARSVVMKAGQHLPANNGMGIDLTLQAHGVIYLYVFIAPEV